MLEAKSLIRAVVPSSLLQYPSPAHLQSTRLAIHVPVNPNFGSSLSVCVFPSLSFSLTRLLQLTFLLVQVSSRGSSCWIYIASGCSIYKVEIPLEDSLINRGKESLLIPVHTEVVDSLLLKRCPHRFEIQSIVIAQNESSGDVLLGSVDSFGHLIVSKGSTDRDVDKLTFSASPRDCGVGEGSWAGLCFSPNSCST